MFNIQLSVPKKSMEVLPSCKGKQPRASRMVTVHGRHRAQSQGATPRRIFPGVQHAGNKRFLPRGAAGGCPRGSTSPAAPSPHWEHKLQLQLHRDSLGRIQQGLGFRALFIICIIFSDPFSFACLLSRQHSRGSHEDEPVAVRTEGVLHLTRHSALVSAPLRVRNHPETAAVPSAFPDHTKMEFH